jgi:signal transduction histidine kinase
VPQRLLLVTTLASSSALAIAVTTLAVLDEGQSRRDALGRRGIDAEMIGLHTASALVFDDAAAARDTLAALRVKTDVEHACIYGRDKRLFAAYDARGRGCPPVLEADAVGSSLRDDRVLVARPVLLDDEPVGTVVIESNLNELALRSRRLVLLGLGVSVVAFAGGLLISWRYQRSLSVPLLALAHTAQEISDGKDYSKRVSGAAPGEIGVLMEKFNEMLEGIQQRDHELLGVQLQLEDRVRERTEELQRELSVRREAEEEVKRLNGALSVRLDEVTTLNQEIESFSYSVSHDLRAPLRHVSGFVDLLRERAASTLDETCQRYLGVIAKGATQMGCLIDDLLGFSRMSRLELHHRNVALDALVSEVKQEVERDAVGRDICWAIAPLPTVRGDRAMLRVVFVNLLSNAVKYSRGVAQARIEVGWEREGGLGRIFVRDNGVGFDMRYVDKLFGVFQRLHKAEEFEGTGIGLATVRRIVNRHGGEAWAESEPGRGSTFHVSLTLAEGV